MANNATTAERLELSKILFTQAKMLAIVNETLDNEPEQFRKNLETICNVLKTLND